jgi:gliding motility-associated-like protein
MKVVSFIFCLTFLFINLNAQIPFECKGQYYLSLTRSGASSSGLYEVKINPDGTRIILDTISPSIGLVLNAMGYRITDNFIYGMDPNTARLRKIGKDGVATDLGRPKDIPTDRVYFAGDVTPDGKYLILIGLGGSPAQIVKVDLESPDYQCTFVSLKTTVSIVDVAFDPFSGQMYGHDLANKRLVIINPDDGTVNTNFVRQPQVDQLGALFFDSFGNLFGYGAYGTLIQDKFVAVDKKTGEIRLLASGPLSSGQDGCACPYTLELQKTVFPDTTYPCTEVLYSFIVSNGSGQTRSGIVLEDIMPNDFKIKGVNRNPYGGKVEIGNNKLKISEMIVPAGIDTIKVWVEIGENALGKYNNQAILSGLPPALGSFTFSDNPSTFIEKDSTPVFIQPLDISFIEETYQTCENDSVFIDAELYGVQISWSDSVTSSKRWLSSPGNYTLTAKTGCDQKVLDIKITSDLLAVDIKEDTLFIKLGETAFFNASVLNIDEKYEVIWSQTQNNPSVSCDNCLNNSTIPLFDGYYIITVINAEGCVVKDSVYIRVKKDRNLYYPNIISSNNDGKNDRFFLTGDPKVGNGVFLRIYDRWGNKVYDSENFTLSNPDNGWDGTFKGQAVVAGVYTWIAQVKFIDGFVLVKTGDLTILK